MADIVERLREEARDWKVGPVVSEAADEIERRYRGAIVAVTHDEEMPRVSVFTKAT